MDFTPLDETRAAWAEATPARRFIAVREAARRLRDRILASGLPEAIVTRDLISLPYPLDYAFNAAVSLPLPFIMFTNRMNVVQYLDAAGARRTLLVNPSDYERNAEAPYYKKLAEKYGEFLSHRVLSRPYGMAHAQLAALGLRADDVDFITFDHLHVQDVRRWLGAVGPGDAAVFPKAKLLVERREWLACQLLHPMQRPWYVDGGAAIPEERVVVFDGDVLLGKGVALVSTTGHTEGNHTIVLNSPKGLCTISENGVGLDNYAPELSQIPGVRKAAKFWDAEVLLNANTRERSCDQYTSMVLEKTLSDPCPNERAFPWHLSSSEFRAATLFPGLAPTATAALPDFGSLVPRARRAA